MDPLSTLEQSLRDARTPQQSVAALNALGAEWSRRGEGRRALEAARQARDIAAASGDPALDAQARHALARGHFYLSEFMPAMGFLLEAAQLYQQVGDLSGAASAFAGLGLCQMRLGAADDALVSLLRALQMTREQGLVTLQINVLNSLVATTLVTRQFDDAEQYLREGIALAEAVHDDNLLAKLLHNGALLRRRRGDELAARGEQAAAQEQWQLALEQVGRALELNRARGSRWDAAHSLGESGALLRLLGRHAEAERALLETLALSQTIEGLHTQAETQLELGLLRAAVGREDEARSLLEEAIACARRIGAQTELAEACRALSELHERRGDAVQALALYKEFHALRAGELAGSRKQAAAAARLWLDYQEAARRADSYRQRAETLSREAEVALAASHQDPLTGLLNRRGFEARLQRLRPGSGDAGLPLALVVVDIDHFKSINDGFSHAVGDVVLQGVAQTLQAHCRHEDLAVRWGGDEFVLVLVGVELDAARPVVQRLQAAMRQREWQQHSAGLAVTLSIGMAPMTGSTPFDAALASADQALYEAKHQGRDRAVG